MVESKVAPAVEARLVAHRGAKIVARAELARIPAPPSLGRIHKPIPHHELVATLHDALGEHGLTVTREQYAVQDGAKGGVEVPSALLFGTLEVRGDSFRGLERAGQGFALGVRSGNNKKMPLELAAGARVFVCDNLAFTAEMIALQKRHTKGLDLRAELIEGVGRYVVKQMEAVKLTDGARAKRLQDVTAKAIMLDTFAAGVLPVRFLPEVVTNYFEPKPEMTDCQGKTLWSLHNAFTRILAPVAEEVNGVRVERIAPRSKFAATVALGKVLELAGTL